MTGKEQVNRKCGNCRFYSRIVVDENPDIGRGLVLMGCNRDKIVTGEDETCFNDKFVADEVDNEYRD